MPKDSKMKEKYSYDPEFDVALLFTRARLDKGWTQGQLARRLKTKQPGVARWENCRHSPRIEILIKLAEIQGKKLYIDIR